jgi:hypothetical protein
VILGLTPPGYMMSPPDWGFGKELSSILLTAGRTRVSDRSVGPTACIPDCSLGRL